MLGILGALWLSAFALVFAAEEPKGDFICPEKKPEVPKNIERGKVYEGMPYDAGEIARYEMRYGPALAGYGTIETRSPKRHKSPGQPSLWYRNFHISARTGEWYRMIFAARYEVDSVVRAWDGGGGRFYLDQDEAQFTGKRVNTKRWIEFNHEECKVDSKRDREGNIKEQSHELSFGALDTLGVAFWMREQEFKIGKVVRGLVYSNGKSWWLEATPVVEEKIKTEAGEFDTVKLALVTFLGDIAQQRGEAFVWIAHKNKNRQIVQGTAELVWGSFSMKLVEYTAGGSK